VLSTITGTTCSVQKVPAGWGRLLAVSCRSSSVCEAVGQSQNEYAQLALGTVNGGASWSNQKLPGHVYELFGLTCVAAPAACFAVGVAAQGLILVYR
jgi:hypothetical protein